MSPIKDEALLLLERVGLESEEKSIIATLSGGMKRRVSIARLLLIESDVYLLDEPFNGLDAETKKLVASIIKEKTEGKTIFVVSHADEDGALLRCGREIAL